MRTDKREKTKGDLDNDSRTNKLTRTVWEST